MEADNTLQQPLKEVTKEEVVFILPVAFQKLG